jgi:chaperone modulatory protein CbpM
VKEQEFLQQLQLDRVTLQMWISETWLAPMERAGETDFSEIDLARALLIKELKADMGVNDQGIGVILHLLDQLHGLRQAMKEFLGQPQEAGASRPQN